MFLPNHYYNDSFYSVEIVIHIFIFIMVLINLAQDAASTEASVPFNSVALAVIIMNYLSNRRPKG